MSVRSRNGRSKREVKPVYIFYKVNVVGNTLDNFTEAKRNDSKVVTAKTENRDTDKNTEYRSGNSANDDSECYSEP